MKRLLRQITECFYVKCFHAHVGWPMTSGEQAIPYQHCLDCGAQRMYSMQPELLAGPWRHQRFAPESGPRLLLDQFSRQQPVDCKPTCQDVDEVLTRYEVSLRGEGCPANPRELSAD